MKHNFEKLDIWKDGVDLAEKVIKSVSESTNWGLRDQLCRSSISVPSNIAEGCERQTPKELSRYLSIAAGSSGEVRTQLIIAGRIGELEKDFSEELVENYRKLSAQIYAFKNKISN